MCVLKYYIACSHMCLPLFDSYISLPSLIFSAVACLGSFSIEEEMQHVNKYLYLFFYLSSERIFLQRGNNSLVCYSAGLLIFCSFFAQW